MRKARAFTLVEMLITVTLTAIVLCAVAGIYVFATVHLSDAYTKTLLNDQMNGIADRIEATIRDADSCTTKDGGATIQCGMPTDGVDADGDGHLDTYYPDGTDSKGNGTFSVGNYVWIYNADSCGAYKSGAGMVWRAERKNSGTIHASDIDTSFAYYSPALLRYPLVNSVSFVVNSAASCVTFTIVGSTQIGQAASTGSSDMTANRGVTLTRTVCWRN